MQRLRVIEESAGPIRFVGADNDMLWGASPATTIERGVDRGAIANLPEAPRVVLRSARPVDDAASSFATWSNAGWDSFEADLRDAIELCDNTKPKSKALLWPGVGSVLSDGVSTLSFARKHESVGLVIDPVAWITGSMRADAEDHLSRFADALSLCETLKAVVIREVPATETLPAIDAGSVESLLARAIGRAGFVALA